MKTLLFAFCLFTSAVYSQTFEQLTHSALQASGQGKYTEAISLFNKALLLDTGNYIVYDQLAYNHYQLGQLDSTILYAQRTLKNHPTDTAALVFRAHSYMDMEKYEEAIADFTKAFETTHRRNADASYNIGKCYGFLREYDKAIEYFQITLALQPTDKYSLFELGYCYAGKAQPDKDKALEHYNKALAQDSLYYNAYLNRGLLYAMQFQILSKAHQDLEKSISLKPKNRTAYYYNGVLYLNEEAFDKAKDMFNKVIEYYPDYAEAYYERAITWYRIGVLNMTCKDLDKAESLGYKRAIESKKKYCK